MRNHQEQQPQQASLSQNLNVLIGLVQIISKAGDVFMRRPGTWGSRHANFQMALSFIVLFCFGPMTFPRESPTPMLYLFVAAIALLLVHRIAGWLRSHRVHSMYTGRSWFTGKEATAKMLLEPMGVALLGALVGD